MKLRAKAAAFDSIIETYQQEGDLLDVHSEAFDRLADTIIRQRERVEQVKHADVVFVDDADHYVTVHLPIERSRMAQITQALNSMGFRVDGTRELPLTGEVW